MDSSHYVIFFGKAGTPCAAQHFSLQFPKKPNGKALFAGLSSLRARAPGKTTSSQLLAFTY
jgi:hypothetical protein